jgi:hypothetical protein
MSEIPRPLVVYPLELLAQIPEPPGVHMWDDWDWNDDKAVYERCFDAKQWTVSNPRGRNIDIALGGSQNSRGELSDWSLYMAHDALDAEGARKLAATLVKAADELERVRQR